MFHLFKSQYHAQPYPKTDGANLFAKGNGKPQHAQDELSEVLSKTWVKRHTFPVPSCVKKG